MIRVATNMSPTARRMMLTVCAMTATWRPFSIATSAATSATIVLPEPTSPCSSRFIGCGRCMSATISLSAFF